MARWPTLANSSNVKMNAPSPKSSFAKLGLCSRRKPFRVMVLGQSGVGKSALVVRYITRRFIGEYDPTLEKVYSHTSIIDNETVGMEILDSVGQHCEKEYINLEANIRWADAFILMYSITDKCSFDECYRFKFLINYNKRRRKLGSSNKDHATDVPVIFVGNKNDLQSDRMISIEDGYKRSNEIGCLSFHEISVRESIEQVSSVFTDCWNWWRMVSRSGRAVRRAASDPPPHPPTPTITFTLGGNSPLLQKTANGRRKRMTIHMGTRQKVSSETARRLRVSWSQDHQDEDIHQPLQQEECQYQ